MLNHKIGSRLMYLGSKWTLTKVDAENWYIIRDDGYAASYSLLDTAWRPEGNSAVTWDRVRKPTIIIG